MNVNLIPQDRFFQDLFDFRRDFDQIFNRILFNKPALAEQVVLLQSLRSPPQTPQPTDTAIDEGVL